LQVGELRLRQLTRLREEVHQSPVLTSRRDISAAEIAFRMLGRWRQCFSSYLCEEYALDALVDYDPFPHNPARDVPNPKRIEMTAKLQRVRAEFDRLTAAYRTEALMNAEKSKPTS